MVWSVMPPEASSGHRSPTISTALRMVAASILSSSTASANPTSSTSRSCSSVSTSISILTRWPAEALARSSTARMPPATAMWLSLISMASSSPKRWLKPPPQRTAYFSSARSPGVVLRVQQMRVRAPSTRRTNSCVAVATPERWPSRLSATRSAASTARAGPSIVISVVFSATRAPSRACGEIVVSGASLAKAAAASGRPEITPASRAITTARACALSGMVAIEVTSPARPRSSVSARVTTASISSGDRKASGQSREVVIAGEAHRLHVTRSSLVSQIHYALDRASRPRRDRGIDHDLFPEMDQAVENLGQHDPLHVRAEIARPDEFDLGQLGLHVVGHRALRHHDHPARTVLAHPVDHAGGGAGVIRLADHVGRAFRVGDDLQRGIIRAIAAQLLGGKTLVHLAGALPGDDLHAGMRGHVMREVAVGQEDHRVGAEALHHLDRVRGGAADVDLGLHLG